MKRYISLILALLLFSFQGCSPKAPPEETPLVSSSEYFVETEPDITAQDFIMAENGKPLCTLIYPEEANPAVIANALSLRKIINKYISLTGTKEMQVKTDWYMPSKPPAADAPEILIGETNRQESIDVYASLTDNTYIIRVVGAKLVIAASDENLLAYAVSYFEDHFLLDKSITSTGFSVIPGDTDMSLTMPVMTLEKMIKSDFNITALYTPVYQYSAIADFKGTQGSCTDGTYIYISLHRTAADGVETEMIKKVRMSDWTEVALSEELSLNHCNDMCFNPDINSIVITNMNGPKLTFIDPDTLKITNTVDLKTPYTAYAIAYNSNKQKYVIAASGNFLITDKELNILATVPKTSNSNYIGQGMDCDDNFIYMPMSSNKSAGTTENIILIFDWNLRLVKTVELATTMESETMFNFGGIQYVSFNNWGGSKVGYIAKIEYKLYN